MKSVSVYAITRQQNMEQLQKLERQLSGREHFLRLREWELDSMRALVKQLELHMQKVSALRFFYSFQIPRLGKEFDLIQIKDEHIVNIELKSGAVSDEMIKKQLIQNRYYLSVLTRPIYSYTYISSENRLVRLTNHDHIVEADWESLCDILGRDSRDYQGDIEELFKAEYYLISPLTDPVKFLNKEYFLTSQQRDIRRQILRKIRAEHSGYFLFTGLPGTGKTLLLYDIAMGLSDRRKVCMIHCSEAGKKWEILHERLHRIDFLSDSRLLDDGDDGIEVIHDGKDIFAEYSAVLVDEAHLLSVEKLRFILRCAGDRPVIFSSDSEDMISPYELDRGNLHVIEGLPGIQIFRLTNRIRTNAELSSFIQNIMHIPAGRRLKEYPHIEVVYANDDGEAANLLEDYRGRGYWYKADGGNSYGSRNVEPSGGVDSLVVVMDDHYYYDEEGYLRSLEAKDKANVFNVRSLFHYLNQAKEILAIVVKGNPDVYAGLMNVLQGKREKY
ncbi:ATP-binding protein [Coprococcus sp. OM04-5BH]|uniref:DNA/RNA helicase domain-containing protein n=1 Tax=Coprococcus sp. OM04-5BH TaxID=2293093 RepID=UPI000E4F862D|nr:DNA/RNA helicase domain-containing protein [Coprococcus sp. OM04-5BH]RHV33995.1 ATP-binding protein [Coprococcus sp. OM04-5BH]